MGNRKRGRPRLKQRCPLHLLTSSLLTSSPPRPGRRAVRRPNFGSCNGTVGRILHPCLKRTCHHPTTDALGSCLRHHCRFPGPMVVCGEPKGCGATAAPGKLRHASTQPQLLCLVLAKRAQPVAQRRIEHMVRLSWLPSVIQPLRTCAACQTAPPCARPDRAVRSWRTARRACARYRAPRTRSRPH